MLRCLFLGETSRFQLSFKLLFLFVENLLFSAGKLLLCLLQNLFFLLEVEIKRFLCVFCCLRKLLLGEINLLIPGTIGHDQVDLACPDKLLVTFLLHIVLATHYLS